MGNRIYIAICAQRRAATLKSRHIFTIFALVMLLTSCNQASTAVPTTPPTNTPPPDPATLVVGSWTTTITKEDLVRIVPDFLQEYLCNNSGTFVRQFNADGTFTTDQTALEGCPKLEQTHYEDTWSNEGNVVTFGKGTPDAMEYEWAVDGDLLTLKHKAGGCIPCRATETANSWKRLTR